MLLAANLILSFIVFIFFNANLKAEPIRNGLSNFQELGLIEDDEDLPKLKCSGEPGDGLSVYYAEAKGEAWPEWHPWWNHELDFETYPGGRLIDISAEFLCSDSATRESIRQEMEPLCNAVVLSNYEVEQIVYASNQEARRKCKEKLAAKLGALHCPETMVCDPLGQAKVVECEEVKDEVDAFSCMHAVSQPYIVPNPMGGVLGYRTVPGTQPARCRYECKIATVYGHSHYTGAGKISCNGCVPD